VSHFPIVACISDFGSKDFYAGAVRGILMQGVPEGQIAEITHEIPAGDIRRGGLMLWEVQPSFPQGTIFLAVIDPEVGGNRRAAVFHFPECDLVCPDNGTATFLLERFRNFQAVDVDPMRLTGSPPSNTFHGRDLFAPLAVQLAQGKSMDSFGSPMRDPVRLSLPLLAGEETRGWEGEVLYSDHYGNVITSIGRISFDLQSLTPWIHTGAEAGSIAPGMRLLLEDGTMVPLCRTYAEAKDLGTWVALAGSNGLLEVAAWQSPADRHPALAIGSKVKLVSH
jgi:S-adenosylmethionine hydrolase